MNGSIPRRPEGFSNAARFFQWLWDRTVRDLELFAGPGIRISKTTRGTVIESTAESGESGTTVDQYILVDATAGDYFVCRSLSVSFDTTDPEDPVIVRTIGAENVFIAKPFHLRQSSFDRDVLNGETPGNIGTTDEITYDIAVESWDDPTFSTATKKLSFKYKSATFRIATDETEVDPDDWTTQNQTIIPRFVPAVLAEPGDGPVTSETITPTIIYAVKCSGLGITRPGEDDSTIDVTLLALSDGWAWAKTS